jgi:hypothetical protein
MVRERFAIQAAAAAQAPDRAMARATAPVMPRNVDVRSTMRRILEAASSGKRKFDPPGAKRSTSLRKSSGVTSSSRRALYRCSARDPKVRRPAASSVSWETMTLGPTMKPPAPRRSGSVAMVPRIST